MVEEIPEGTTVQEFCKKVGINYAEFVVAKTELLKFGAIHMYKDILYVRPEDEENVKAYFLRRSGDTGQYSQARQPMPSVTAMIVPPTELISQGDIDTLVDKVAAEEPVSYSDASEETTALSIQYSESDSYKEPAKKGDDWEDILTARLEQGPETSQRNVSSQPGNLATQLSLRAKGTRLMRDMIEQAKKDTSEIQQQTYETERQVSAARPYQLHQELILWEEAIVLIEFVLREYAIPEEIVESIAIAGFGNYAMIRYGLDEIIEPKKGIVDQRKLEEALEGFLSEFYKFSEQRKRKTKRPSILDVEGFSTWDMYVSEFDDTMADFVKSLGLRIKI